jgi:hypothetical protein
VHDSDYIHSNSQGEPIIEHTEEDQQPQLEEPYRVQNFIHTNLTGVFEEILERSHEDSHSVVTATPGAQGLLNQSQT